ncbi:MAG TPA: DUF222 domain-containing protein [Mycobacteriales bacterium]|nr:DUF222 domain-containing protein [Mycobacteriales bacterium]
MAAALAAGLDKLDADQCLDAVHDLERVSAVVEAWKARVYARFSPVRAGEPLAELATDEIALELGVTRNAAGNRLYLAEALVERLPGTLAALERGEVDLPKARVLEELTHPLSPRPPGGGREGSWLGRPSRPHPSSARQPAARSCASTPTVYAPGTSSAQPNGRSWSTPSKTAWPRSPPPSPHPRPPPATNDSTPSPACATTHAA